MAQRGEIQCAESQFALQSGRREKPEKFRIGGTLQRKRNALASLCVPIQAISGPLSKHEERLSHILDSCLAVKRQTRNLEKETWKQEELKE